MRFVHLTAAAIWVLLAIPTLIWWKDSVLWVATCSLYANAWIHISGWQGAKAERAAQDG